MPDTERPSVPQQEQQSRAAENLSMPSSGANTAQGRLEALIRKYDKLDELKKELDKETCIVSVEGQNKTKELKVDLQKIVEEIQRPSSPVDQIRLPNITQTIINTVNLKEISSESAPVIYELLRVSTSPRDFNLNTPEGMASALKVMLGIAPAEPLIARRIIDTMIKDAQQKGCTNEQLKDALLYINPLQTSSSEIKARRKEREAQYTAVLSPVQGVTLGEVAQERIRLAQSAFLREAQNSGMSAAQAEEFIQSKINVETEKMRGEITLAINDVVASLGSQNEKIKAMGKYNGVLSRLRSEGKISQADFHLLYELPTDPLFTQSVEDMNKRMEGDDLVQRAMQVFVPTEQQIRILRGISSASSLKAFLLSEPQTPTSNVSRYMVGGPNGTLKWDVFMNDVRGIFGELLSIADRNPNQFFDQAFNPMYEGHLYQVLLQRLKHLGTQIDMRTDDDWFKKDKDGERKITIIEQIADPSPATDKPPYKLIVHPNKNEHSFAVAVGDYLANNMNNYKHVREHLHNINAICTQGLGWEQLKQYSERLSLDKLDNLVRQEEDLSLASNFYSAALQQEVAANGRVTTSQFGKGDEVWQLNSAEKKAFFQMKAHLASKHPELSDSALNQQAGQKIRMAAAIAAGLTGEFWNIMLTARMPIGTENTVNAVGETVNQVANPYTGTGHRGYEKMIVELDLDMVLQRFALPKLYNDVRYTPRYRDMEHPPSAWSKEGYFQHGLASEARSQIEDAMINGRSDRLIEMDERYVYFIDYMRTKCVGLFARAGWRFNNWEACKAYTDTTNKQVDYVNTLKNVRRMGSYITKTFIDSLKDLKDSDIEKMTVADVNALLGPGINKAGSQLSRDEKKGLLTKESLYERLLFEQIGNVTPSKFLQLEERRWIPAGEEMLRDHLYEYLKQQLGKNYPDGFLNLHVYNMYVSALTLAEKSTWMKKKEGKEDPNYTFSSLDIDDPRNPQNRAKLLNFFKQYKTDIGEHTPFGRKISITESDDDFIRILKGFHETLRNSIAPQRYHRAHATGERETLQKRFANMLDTKGGDSKGNIGNLIAGDDFDMENFYFNAGGGYGVPRMMGETFAITSKMNPAIKKLIIEALPDFVKGQYKDIHEVEKAIKEKIVPIFKDVHGAIDNMDRDQANEFCISLALFVANMVGKDRILRIKGIGSLIDFGRRQRGGGSQSSVYAEFFRNTAKRPTHSMDSDEIYAFGHVIFNALDIPFSERIPDHVEVTHSVGGRPIGTKTIYKDEINPEYEEVPKKFLGLIPYKHKQKKHREGDFHKWHEEIFAKAAGLTGATKWLENYLPMLGGAIVMLLLAMAYLASQKNKKK